MGQDTPMNRSSAIRRLGVPVALVVGWLVLVVAAAAAFALQTAMVSRFQAPDAIAPAAAAAGIALIAVAGLPKRAEVASLGIPGVALALMAGAVAFTVTPYAVFANRHSDAPSGSVVVFWTTAFLGFALVAIASLMRRSLTSGLPRTAAALLALVGAAGVLGNWERPSSFSLLVRFGPEQLAMLLASLACAAAVVALVAIAGVAGRRAAVSLAGAGALLAALGIAAPSLSASIAAMQDRALVAYAAASALFAVVLVTLVLRAGAALAGAALLAVPSALTLITYVEERVRALGPRPVLLDAVMWASAAVLAGGYLVVRAEGSRAWRPGSRRFALRSVLEGTFESGAAHGRRFSLARTAGIALGATAVSTALAGLLLTGLGVQVQGVRTDMAAFFVKFEMMGYETAGGWLAFALASLLLSEWVAPVRRTAFQALGTLAATSVGAAAWYAIRYMPLHTWVTWIPPDVQQDFGTEYASITFSAVPVMAQTAAVALACTAAALLALEVVAGGRDDSAALQEGRTT